MGCRSGRRAAGQAGWAGCAAKMYVAVVEYSPGDPNSTEHERYLLELGRAAYEAAGLAGITLDILRTHGGIETAAMYDDPLGTLESRLRGMLKRQASPWPELPAFIDDLDEARELRNDLIHAVPVRPGLYRRRTKDLYYEREFFTVESLTEAAKIFRDLRARGVDMLYRDGGAAVRAWWGGAP